MTAWQNRPVSPTATDTYLYDGSGSRVEQQSVVSGTTSDTAYLLGGVEEVTGGVVTKYLGVAGLPQAIRVGTAGALNYLTSDGLGSVSEALDGAGNVVAAQLYTPYGEGMRSSSGTMPTDHGFTGQIADTTTGLDYYGARSYDPASQQFTSADTLMSGVNRYAYVGDNPTTNVDPTGHFSCAAEDCGLGSGQEGGDDIIFQDVMNSLDGDLTEYSDAADAYVRSLPLNEVTAPEASGPELVVNQGVLTAWRTGVAVTQPGAPSGNGMPDWVNQKGAQEAAIQARGQGTPPPPPPPTPPHNGVHTPPVTLGGAATGLGATFTGDEASLCDTNLYGDACLGYYFNPFGSTGAGAGSGGVNPTPYGGPGGGHHIHAKMAFSLTPAYNPNQALALSNAVMLANGWQHISKMTPMQHQLFTQLGNAVSAGTARNTMLAHDTIAVDVLWAGGVPFALARHFVAQSLWNLRGQGVTAPSYIPWVGPFPGTFR